MNIKYICPHWGSEKKTATAFLQHVIKEGYQGVEINFPEDNSFINGFFAELENIREARPDFIFIAQCVPDDKRETVEEHIVRVTGKLERLAAFSPLFINSHTGKDYYTFEENCCVIEAVDAVAKRKGVRILHETHRGRFSFHGPSLLPYLERFPEIELVADYSHWCTVSESMLMGQRYVLDRVMPHISHIHARVGHEQGPQVSDPFAPEWQQHMECFLSWWKDILHYKAGRGEQELTITLEFGPAPYMPALPFTCQPVGNQWKINSKMKEYLRINLI